MIGQKPPPQELDDPLSQELELLEEELEDPPELHESEDDE